MGNRAQKLISNQALAAARSPCTRQAPRYGDDGSKALRTHQGWIRFRLCNNTEGCWRLESASLSSPLLSLGSGRRPGLMSATEIAAFVGITPGPHTGLNTAREGYRYPCPYCVARETESSKDMICSQPHSNQAWTRTQTSSPREPSFPL